MVVHKRVKIFGKNIGSLASLFYQVYLDMFLKSIFWNVDWELFLIFITRNTNADIFFFSILWISLILTGKFMPSKSSFLAKSLSIFLILAEWWSAGYKCLTKHHSKRLLSSLFWILIEPFLEWFISFGN